MSLSSSSSSSDDATESQRIHNEAIEFVKCKNNALDAKHPLKTPIIPCLRDNKIATSSYYRLHDFLNTRYPPLSDLLIAKTFIAWGVINWNRNASPDLYTDPNPKSTRD